MSYHYQQVKRYKRGAKWPDGEPRMCTRCGAQVAHEMKSRRKQAVVTAMMCYAKTKFKLPVAYCDEHIPDQLVKT